MYELAVIMEQKERINKLVRSNSLRDKDERKSNTDLSRMSIWSFYLMEIGKKLFIILSAYCAQS